MVNPIQNFFQENFFPRLFSEIFKLNPHLIFNDIFTTTSFYWSVHNLMLELPFYKGIFKGDIIQRKQIRPELVGPQLKIWYQPGVNKYDQRIHEIVVKSSLESFLSFEIKHWKLFFYVSNLLFFTIFQLMEKCHKFSWSTTEFETFLYQWKNSEKQKNRKMITLTINFLKES